MNRRTFAKLAASITALASLPRAAADEYDGSPWVYDGQKDYYRLEGRSVSLDEFQAQCHKTTPVRCEGAARAWLNAEGVFVDTRQGKIALTRAFP